MTFKEYADNLERKIIASYEEGVTLTDAESLAGEFLAAQMSVSRELHRADLDARMRKAGLKAIKAAVYLETIKSNDKKPTEAAIAAIIDTDDIVKSEQNSFDTAEADRDELERLYNVFIEAHRHFKMIAKAGN